MSNFKGNRVVKEGLLKLEAPASEAFPLFCPKREEDWLDGWTFRMIHSESGFAETGCVFQTDFPNEGPTLWLVREIDPVNHYGEYVRFMPNLAVITLSFTKTEEPASSVIFKVTRTCTGVTEHGNLYVEKESAGFDGWLTFLEKALNHYLKTGEMLKN